MLEADPPHEKKKFPWALKIAAVVIIVICLVGLFLPPLETAIWVGRTDLEIQFVVADSKTGLPIPQATISIRHEEVSPKERAERDFTLTTDQNGIARHMLKNCTSTGRLSLLEDTYHVYEPYWSFHASAAGYVDSQQEYFNHPEISRPVKRGPPFATSLVLIRLEKK